MIVELNFLSMAVIIFLPFLAAAFTFFIYPVLKEKTAYFAAFIALICAFLILNLIGTTGSISIPLISSLDIHLRFYVDGLSILVGLLASGMGLLTFIYSFGYMKTKTQSPTYYASLLVFMGSMLGIVFSADLIVLFVFWELTSLSSYLLIGYFNHESSSRSAAKKALVITSLGGFFMLLGFLLIHSLTGSFDLTFLLSQPESIQFILRENGIFLPILFAIIIAGASKSAQIPFHIWLPSAMVAPTPVSAFLHSAAMVKAGVYIFGRFHPILAGDEWSLILITLGISTMVITAFFAIISTTLKELLAYSTASHIGLMLIGFGIPLTLNGVPQSLGFVSGSFHLFNHALFKATLFLIAGIITYQVGLNTISEIKGLRKKLPLTAGFAVFASLCMAGIPPTSGFYSKELLFQGIYAVANTYGGIWWLLPLLTIMASAFAVVYSLRFVMIFFGTPSSDQQGVSPLPLSMMLPTSILTLLSLLTIFYLLLPIDLISQSGSPYLQDISTLHVGFPAHIDPPLLMSLLSILFGIVLFSKHEQILKRMSSILPFTHFSVDSIYFSIISTLETWSSSLTYRTERILLRTHIIWLLGLIGTLALASFLYLKPHFLMMSGPPLRLDFLVFLLIIALGALAVVRANSHIMGVLFLSILGFMIAVFYLLSNAPDVALTQLAVETLILVVFLVIIGKLPAYYGEASSPRVMRDILLSLFIGVTIFLTVLLATTSSVSKNIATFFIDRASYPPAYTENIIVDYGGGTNIVNVILVDFRALDTLGEISVVALAALSILTILSSRKPGGQS